MMWKIVVFSVIASVIAVGLDGSMVGGFTDVNANDEGLRVALNEAVDQHNRRANDVFLRKVAEVVTAQKQVVAGVKYVLTVKMAKSSCRKDRANEGCDINLEQEQTPTYLCKFTVWSRPWLPDIKVLGEKCDEGNL